MKYILLGLIAMVSVNGVKLSAPPKKEDNWKTDPLHGFDDSHYSNNNVKNIFPEHFDTKPRGDNPNCSSCCPFPLSSCSSQCKQQPISPTAGPRRLQEDGPERKRHPRQVHPKGS